MAHALDELVEQQLVVCKENGKQKIYWANQDADGTAVGADAMAALNEQHAGLKEEVAGLREQLGRVEKENQTLARQYSNEELARLEKTLGAEVGQMEARLQLFQQKKVVVDPKEKERLLKARASLASQWRKRKKMVKEIADLITEARGIKVAAFYEQLGIETDEQVGFTLEMFEGKK